MSVVKAESGTYMLLTRELGCLKMPVVAWRIEQIDGNVVATPVTPLTYEARWEGILFPDGIIVTPVGDIYRSIIEWGRDV